MIDDRRNAANQVSLHTSLNIEFTMDTFLQLKNIEPVTFGAVRWVFVHPDDPDLIVKVIRTDAIEERFGSKTKWYKRPRRYGIYLSYIREIQEFVTIHAKHNTYYHFLQRVVGLAQTDLGLGLVLEAIRSPDGGLAPTLRILINTGKYNQTTEDALERFFKQLLEADVIINDLNPGNMVYTYSEEHGHYFVLIDGLGNNSIIPLKSISQRLNQRSKQKRFELLRIKVKRYKKRCKLYE